MVNFRHSFHYKTFQLTNILIFSEIVRILIKIPKSFQRRFCFLDNFSTRNIFIPLSFSWLHLRPQRKFHAFHIPRNYHAHYIFIFSRSHYARLISGDAGLVSITLRVYVYASAPLYSAMLRYWCVYKALRVVAQQVQLEFAQTHFRR